MQVARAGGAAAVAAKHRAPRWLRGRSGRAGGPHGHSHCGRGHASPGRCLLPVARPGQHIRDHEEPGVISTLWFPNRRMADDALYKAVKSRNLAETNVRRPIAVVVCCGVR